MADSYRINLKSVEQVKGYSSQQVKQEPALDVIDRYQARRVNNLATLADVRRPEVE